MITKLIALLQWLESSEKPRKWVDFFFSFAFTLMSISAVHMILKETIFQRSYSYMYGYSNTSSMLAFHENITSNLFIFSLTIILLVAIIASYIYGLYKKATTKDFSIVRIIMNSVLPLTMGIFITFLHASQPDRIQWYIYLFGGLYAFSPFVLFLSELFKNKLMILL